MLLGIFTLAVLFSVLVDFTLADEPVDFGRDILPILSENCYHCHGPDEDERQADFRLDTAEGVLAALVHGEPDESELVLRLETDDPDSIMPPADSGFALTDHQKKLFRTWVKEGAKYSRHWAFVTPTKPDVKNIDELVDARLAKEKLKRSPVATNEVLCRRLYLDLIGMPPSPKQIDDFVSVAATDRKHAVDSLVTQLQSTDAYAEKWARHWLDVARYADTNGFEKDMPRDQWAWRDWVIRSIANDQPYDQFVIDQLAGDLILDHTQDQLVATGFLRNGMVNEEGAIVAEQFRIEGIVDRMDCIGKSVLGLTLQCAQCHTHKFDPLTHDEYFGVFAFFNDTYEAQSWVYSDQQQEQIKDIRKQIVGIEQEIKDETPDFEARMKKWMDAERERESLWESLEAKKLVWIGGLNHPEQEPDRSILVLGHPTTEGKVFVTAKPKTRRITAVRVEALRHGDLPFGGPGRSYRGTFAISEVDVWSRQTSDGEWKPVKLGDASADFGEKEGKLEPFFLNRRGGKTSDDRRIGGAYYLVDGEKRKAWRADRGPILRETESVAMIKLAEPLELNEDGEIKIQLTQDHGGDGGNDNLQLGRFRLGVLGADKPALAPHDHAATLAMKKSGDSDAKTRDALFRAWRQTLPEQKERNDRIAKLESTYPEALTSVLHTAKTDDDWKRETRLLDRGVWDQPKHKVAPHTPAALHPLDVESPTRLDFARWLVDKRNPLVARVQVNRVWQAMFGSGLVETSEDFGTRTPPPEHRAVLDWLAVDFMENQWSLKHLVRQIATSETYQQTSRTTPELLERDPNNRLLARGARFRAEAEVVRDIALTAAGLLHEKVGGPSFYPPIPQSLIDYNFFKPEWDPAAAPERYRRSLYVFRMRTMPDPVLSTFDAPNSDAACARRVRSNTPLAALVSLNEPVYIEAAQSMALRLLREGGDTDSDRINYAYRLATGRKAKSVETKELLRVLESSRNRLADGWLSIGQIAFSDPENRPELPEGKTPQDVAAWAIVTRIILNLDETLTRN